MTILQMDNSSPLKVMNSSNFLRREAAVESSVNSSPKKDTASISDVARYLASKMTSQEETSEPAQESVMENISGKED
jgi:hypothetical protein